MNKYQYILDTRFAFDMPTWLCRVPAQVGLAVGDTLPTPVEHWRPGTKEWYPITNRGTTVSSEVELCSEERARELFPDAFPHSYAYVIDARFPASMSAWLYRMTPPRVAVLGGCTLEETERWVAGEGEWRRARGVSRVPLGDAVEVCSEARARELFPDAFPSVPLPQSEYRSWGRTGVWLYRRTPGGVWEYYSKSRWRTSDNSVAHMADDTAFPILTEAQARAQFPWAFGEKPVTQSSDTGAVNCSPVLALLTKHAERHFWNGNIDAAEALRVVRAEIEQEEAQ